MNALQLSGTLSDCSITGLEQANVTTVFNATLHVTSRVPTQDFNGERLEVFQIPVQAVGGTATDLWTLRRQPVEISGRLIFKLGKFIALADSAFVAPSFTNPIKAT